MSETYLIIYVYETCITVTQCNLTTYLYVKIVTQLPMCNTHVNSTKVLPTYVCQTHVNSKQVNNVT